MRATTVSGVLFLLGALGLASGACGRGSGPRSQVDSARDGALARCESLDGIPRGTCLDAARSTVALLSRIEGRQASDRKRLNASGEIAKRGAEEERRRCAGGEAGACLRGTVLEDSQRQVEAAIARLAREEEENRRAAVRRLNGLADLLASRPQPFVAVVKLRPTGRVRAVPVSSLLSHYDDDMARSILEDLGSLSKLVGAAEATAALSCPDGRWRAFPAARWAAIKSQSGASEALKWLTTTDGAKELSSLCDESGSASGTGAVSSPGGGPGPLSGFTGISGLDPMGPLACKAASSAARTPADMIGAVKAQVEAMQKTCGDPGGQGLIAAGDPADPSTSSSPASPSSSSSGSSSTSTDKDGNTTTTTTTTNADGSVTKRVIITDASGKVIHNAVQTKTDTDGDGTLDRSVASIVYPQGDGTFDHEVIVNDKDRHEWHTYTTKSGDSTLYNQRVISHIDWKKSCLDETCVSCRSAVTESTRLALECASGANGVCEAYAATQSCCRAASPLGADPTIIMPTQDEALACGEVNSTDLTLSACKQRCSAASDPDCVERCTSQRPGQLPFDTADLVCRYAYSEDCFASDIEFPMPGGARRRTPTPGPGPPAVYLEHLLFQGYRACDSDTQGSACSPP